MIETGRKITGPGRYGEEGTGRVQRAWVTDPDRVRGFRAGQAAWICGNGYTYVQIAPYRPSPLPLPPVPRPAALTPAVGEREPPDDAGPLPGPDALGGPALPLPGGER